MIELNKLTYNSNVAALSVAGQGIKKSKEQPEITGNMKTLEAFLETYQTLSELFGSYKVSAKYCYAAHESRLHQNDRCKRFALCLVLTVCFRSLAPWGKLFQLFI